MPRRWLTPLILLVVCPAIGIAVGALTNIINVRISPIYYALLMDWNLEETPTLAIGQGMLEGGGLGTAVGLLLAVSVIASTGCRCPTRLAISRAFRAVGIAVICWILGGIAGISLETLDRDLFRQITARFTY